MNLLRKFSFFFLMTLTAVDWAGAAGLTVELRADPVICAKKVTLGDIARISGEDSMTLERVRTIPLLNFPPRAKTKTISRDMILTALKRNKIPRDDLDFIAPDVIRISRKMMTVQREVLETAARRFLEKTLADREGMAQIIRLDYQGKELCLPKGRLELSFMPLNRARPAGIIFLYGRALVDGKPAARLKIKAEIKITGTMAVAARAIQKGEILTSWDFDMERRDVQRVNRSFLTDPEQLIGKRARKSIRKNSLIEGNMLEQPPLVNRKDRVKIVLESKHLKISTIGVAEEDGPKGSYIRVMNLDSRKIIVAKVIGENLVKVEF